MDLVILIKREEANPQTSTSFKDSKQNCPILFCKILERFVSQNDKRILLHVLLCLDHFYEPKHRRRCCMSAGFFFHTPEHGKTNAKLYFLT